MLADARIAFIGSGAMAEAMISGLIEQRLAGAKGIIASGPRIERGDELHARFGITGTTDNAAAASGADIVVLCVKPQMLARTLPELKPVLRPDALVLSIVAGATIESITRELAHPHIVRSMPNTPAQIGQGITVWIAAPSVAKEHKEAARLLLAALGQEIEADVEDQLDMATALSGNGPAYVFLFMEALVDAGVHMGFSRRIAEQLVVQTLKGSVEYYQHTANHLSRLRNQVTSPGGTTAEALFFLEKSGFRTALARAVWAAYQRSVELGQGKKRQSRPD